LHTCLLFRDLAIGEHMQPSSQPRPAAAQAADLTSASARLAAGQGEESLQERGQRNRH